MSGGGDRLKIATNVLFNRSRPKGYPLLDSNYHLLMLLVTSITNWVVSGLLNITILFFFFANHEQRNGSPSRQLFFPFVCSPLKHGHLSHVGPPVGLSAYSPRRRRSTPSNSTYAFTVALHTREGKRPKLKFADRVLVNISYSTRYDIKTLLLNLGQ